MNIPMNSDEHQMVRYDQSVTQLQQPTIQNTNFKDSDEVNENSRSPLQQLGDEMEQSDNLNGDNNGAIENGHSSVRHSSLNNQAERLSYINGDGDSVDATNSTEYQMVEQLTEPFDRNSTIHSVKGKNIVQTKEK